MIRLGNREGSAMTLDLVKANGLVLLGCGKMGGALLEGWLKAGLPLGSIHVVEPFPSARLAEMSQAGLHLNAALPEKAAVAIIAVKPQSMGEALPALRRLGNGSTLFISIAAGTPIAAFARVLGAQTPIIRAMPNTPAAIGRGITALIGNALVGEGHLQLAEALLGAVGQTVRLEDESQMDAVTALSGSGPAYVFHLIEAMAAAGEAQGLSAELAMRLAKATVGGAGELAERWSEDPAQLRVNVTSPGGTTAAALQVLMDADTGFPALLRKAIAAATDRSRELAK